MRPVTIDTDDAEEPAELTTVEPKATRAGRRALITNFAGAALDQNPVAVYLARFPSADARRVQLSALKSVSKLFFKGLDPHKISWKSWQYQHVLAIRTALAEKGLAPATVNRYLSAVKGVCEEAVRLGILDPTEGAKINTVKCVRGSRLPTGRHLDAQADLGPMLDAASELDNKTCAVRDQAILAVLRIAGLRRAELVGIQLKDLSWGRVQLVRKKHPREKKRFIEQEFYTLDGTYECVVRGKGGKQRKAYLANAAPEIKAWLKLRSMWEGPLFCAVHKSGAVIHRQMNATAVRFIVDRVAKAAHVQDVKPHDMRRTFAGELLNSGADISTAQKLMGHASPATTAKYDLRPERVAAQAAKAIQVPTGRRQRPDDEGDT